jgi:hypothetical protein
VIARLKAASALGNDCFCWGNSWSSSNCLNNRAVPGVDLDSHAAPTATAPVSPTSAASRVGRLASSTVCVPWPLRAVSGTLGKAART